MANETKSITFCRLWKKNKKQILPVLLVTAVGGNVVSLLFSQKIMAVISAFNKSTEIFFKNGNEKQLEHISFVPLLLFLYPLRISTCIYAFVVN